MKQAKCKLARDYEKLTGKRNGFLNRGRKYSRMTLPYILPPEGSTVSNKQGYQGIGAEAVNHLSNKIVQALFPVNEPFFKMSLDPKVDMELLNQKFDKSQLAVYYNTITDMAMKHMRKLKLRPLLVQHEKHLIISGNSMLLFTDTGCRQLGIDKYVVRRSPEGQILRVIAKESVVFAELPESVQAVYFARNPNKVDKMKDKELSLYTGFYLQPDGNYRGMQSVDDILVFENPSIDALKVPAIVTRWNATSGEDYGRGIVEDHEGDFHTVSFLSEARARGAATMMDVKFLVKPGSLTDVDTLNEAQTGDYVQGMEGDITVLQLEKYADSRLIESVMTEYQQRIGRAFLMLQSTIRDSERTTKYEVQKLANELDLSMGGIYSSQSEELQGPMAVQLLDMIDERLVNDELVPVIDTGLEALGRARELEKLMEYSQMMALPQQWPESLQQIMDWKAYSDLVASGISLDTSGFFKEQPEPNAAPAAELDNSMANAFGSAMGGELGKKMGEM